MAKITTITKKTHAYILEDGTILRAISAAHVEEYQKEKKQVYSANATKMVDGVKTETLNYYVNLDDFVKRTSARSSLKDKLSAAISGKDLSSMSAADLLALIG